MICHSLRAPQIEQNMYLLSRWKVAMLRHQSFSFVMWFSMKTCADVMEIALFDILYSRTQTAQNKLWDDCRTLTLMIFGFPILICSFLSFSWLNDHHHLPWQFHSDYLKHWQVVLHPYRLFLTIHRAFFDTTSVCQRNNARVDHNQYKTIRRTLSIQWVQPSLPSCLWMKKICVEINHTWGIMRLS